jgi:4-amino-4-deoxychorismate lyase
MSDFLETIKAIDGKVLNLNYHQKRYEDVLNSLKCDDIKQLSEYLHPPKNGVCKCRVVYNEKDISVEYEEYKKRDISTFKLIFNNDIEYDKKTLQRESIDALYQQRGECDEILIIKNLLVSDTSIANIAFWDDDVGVWITPKKPLLKGTTRERFLDSNKIIEADIGVHELRRFTKVALLNAMVEFDILEDFEFVI